MVGVCGRMFGALLCGGLSLCSFIVFVHPVLAAPKVVSYTVTPSSSVLPYGGGEIEVLYASTGADACILTGFDILPDGTLKDITLFGGEGGVFKVTISKSVTFSLYCKTTNPDESSPIVQIPFTVQQSSYPPVITSFTADPVALPVGGGSVTLSWSVSGAAACSMDGVDNFLPSPYGGTETRFLAQTTDFVLTCSNISGNVSESLRVTVGDQLGLPGPQVTLFVLPSTVSYGGTVVVSYGFPNSDVASCVTNGGAATGTFSNQNSGNNGSGQWQGGSGWIAPISGTYTVENVTTGMVFTIECFNANNESSGMKNVSVSLDQGVEPTAYFYVDPGQAVEGGPVKLIWNSNNAEYCTAYSADGSFSGQKSANGSEIVFPKISLSRSFMNGNPTSDPYYLNCTSTSGKTTPFGASYANTPIGYAYSVYVIVRKQPPVMEFSATPLSIIKGQSSKLKWTVSNAKWCELKYINGLTNPNQQPNDEIFVVKKDYGDSGNQVSDEYSVSPVLTIQYLLGCASPQNGYETKRVNIIIESASGSGDNPGSDGPTTSTTCTDPGATCQSGTFCAGGAMKVGTCNNGLSSCCLTGGSSIRANNIGFGSGSGSSSSDSPYFNPLKFDSVEGVLTGVITQLRNIIVILSIIFIIIGSVMYILSAGNEGRMNTAKGAITASLIGLALAIAAPAFLKEIAAILGWTNITDASNTIAGAQTFSQIATKVLDFLLSIVGIIGIIMLVFGGFTYLASAGDEKKAETGKKIVTYAIIAIAVALSALVLVTQVAKFFG